jgi:hypothetical protein
VEGGRDRGEGRRRRREKRRERKKESRVARQFTYILAGSATCSFGAAAHWIF